MDDVLKEAKEFFEAAESAEAENRERWIEDMRFGRMGEQWDPRVVAARQREERPCWTFNMFPAFIRQVTNDARQNKPQIKVYAVDDESDDDTAEILNGLIRSVQVQSNADAAYDTAIDFAASMGVGYFRVNVDYAAYDSFDMDITVDRMTNPLAVYGDPTSTAVDSSDWNTCFVTDLLTEKQFEQMFPGKEKIDWDSISSLDKSDTLWFEENAVRIAEFWKRDEIDTEFLMLSDKQVLEQSVYEKQRGMFDAEGIMVEATRPGKAYKVKQYKMNGHEILEENDWLGRYIPIIPVYGEEVIIEGDRKFFSLTHFAKDAQRSYNAWRTYTTEVVALAPKAPWVGPAGAFDVDAERWATANTQNHAYLEYDADAVARAGGMPPQRQPFAGIPAGALQEAMSASGDMKSVIGIHEAGLGEKSNERSGVAIRARQQEGDTSTFHFADNLNRAIQHAGKIIVDLIPKVYTRPRMARILGMDGSAKRVPLNQEVIPKEDENGEVQYLPAYNLEEMPDGVVPRIFDMTTGKYDVVCESGPSYNTKRQEAADQMLELMRGWPEAGRLIGDLLAKNLDWPEADEIKKRLQHLLPPELKGKGDPKVAEAMKVIEALKAELQAASDDKQERMAKVQTDIKKVEIDSFKAQTDRMKANAEIAGKLTEEDNPDNSFELERMKMDHTSREKALDRGLQIQLAQMKAESDQQGDVLKAMLQELQNSVNAMQGTPSQ